MLAATSLTADPIDLAAALPVSTQIELFLSGASDGAALLGALYDEVLDEPVPDHLTALCRAI